MDDDIRFLAMEALLCVGGEVIAFCIVLDSNISSCWHAAATDHDTAFAAFTYAADTR